MTNDEKIIPIDSDDIHQVINSSEDSYEFFNLGIDDSFKYEKAEFFEYYYSGKTKFCSNNSNNDFKYEENKNENHTIIYEEKPNLFQTSKKKRFKPENIRIKVKVHYHKFIYSFFKDLIKSKFPKKKCIIRKIPHSNTKIVSKEGNRNLMNMSIEQFLSQKISSTFRCESNQNIKNIEKLKKLLSNCEEKKFLYMSYKDFYEKYYLNNEKMEFNFPLSPSTQFFCEYVKTLNESEREIIDNIARNHFIQYFLDGKVNSSIKSNNELNVNNDGNKNFKFNIVKFNSQKK